MFASFQLYRQGLSWFRPFSVACTEGVWARSETERKKSIVMHKETISERKYSFGAVEDTAEIDIVCSSRNTACKNRPVRVEGHYGILAFGLPRTDT